MTRRSYIQLNGVLVPKDQFKGHNERPLSGAQNILPDIEPFVSPIDGKLITSRSVLRAHNKEHAVTNFADFSPEFRAKRTAEREARAHGQDKQATKERIEIIKQVMDQQQRRN